MKELLSQYAAYDLWANQKICEVVLQLTAEQHTQQIISSFPGIHATIQHVWDAASIWWQRLKLQEQVIRPSEKGDYTIEESIKGLLNQSKEWNEWVEQTTDAALQHVFAYYNSKQEYFKQPVWQMLVHLFNHGTYHRGQIVTMLKQLEIEKIPATDFIVFSRKKT